MRFKIIQSKQKILKLGIGNFVYLFVAIYLIVSIILKAYTNIDICIPCLWKLVFDKSCLGCGLTRASVALIQLDFYAAWKSNGIIFLIVPLAIFFGFHNHKGFL